MPFPEAYVALRSTRPVSSSSVGEPLTLTDSVNVTLTWIVSPVRYVPVWFGDETATIAGEYVSITIRLWSSSEPGSECTGGKRALAWGRTYPAPLKCAVEPVGPGR